MSKQPDIIYVGTSITLENLAQYSPMTAAEMETDLELGEDELEILKKAELSPREFICCKSFFWEGYTQGEIAEHLNITQQAVFSYIQRGKKKLRSCL